MRWTLRKKKKKSRLLRKECREKTSQNKHLLWTHCFGSIGSTLLSTSTNIKCRQLLGILKLKYVEWELQTLIKVNYQTLLYALEVLRSWKLIPLFVTRFKELQALWFEVVVRMTLLANVHTICDKSRIDVFTVCSSDILSHRPLLKQITSVKLIKQSHQHVWKHAISVTSCQRTTS